jgi:hypothetical protein
MSWLARLRALHQEDSCYRGTDKTDETPRFVSFVSAQVTQIPWDEGARGAPDAEREAFEERAAIMEYDGGLARTEAERLAADGFVARYARAREAEDPETCDTKRRAEFPYQYCARAREAREPPTSEAIRRDGVFARGAPHGARDRAEQGSGLASRFWPLGDWGDMRPCTRCRNLARSGLCLAAANGLLRAARDYEPSIPEQPRRCIGYAPPADDPEQSPGIERWPELAAWQRRLTDKEIQEVALSQRGPL